MPCVLEDVENNTLLAEQIPISTVVLNRVYPSNVFDKPAAIPRSLELVEQLESRGFRVLNGLQATRADYSKLYSAQLMERAGVRTPRTVYLSEEFAKGDRPFLPVVVKLDTGGFGREAQLLQSREEWTKYIRGCDWEARPRIIQEFIRTEEPADFRITVMFGQVVFSYMRALAEGWMGSVERGAQPFRCQAIPDNVHQLAIEASKAIDAQINGVDIIVDRVGPAIIENNPTPAFSLHAWEALGFDPIATLCERIMEWAGEANNC